MSARLILDGQGATTHALLAAFPSDAASTDAELAERQAAAVPDDRRRRFERTVANGRLSLARWRGDFAGALDRAQAIRCWSRRRRATSGCGTTCKGWH